MDCNTLMLLSACLCNSIHTSQFSFVMDFQELNRGSSAVTTFNHSRLMFSSQNRISEKKLPMQAGCCHLTKQVAQSWQSYGLGVVLVSTQEICGILTRFKNCLQDMQFFPFSLSQKCEHMLVFGSASVAGMASL